MFVYDFFRTLVSLGGPLCVTIDLDVSGTMYKIFVNVTDTEFVCDRCDLLEVYFRPCLCEAGHPILFALRPFPKVCSCKSWLSLESTIEKSLATILISDGVYREREARTRSKMVS